MRSCIVMLLLGVAAAPPALADPLRDPTRPTRPAEAVAPETSVGNLAVSAVFISGSRRLAVVNGHRVREGEAIGNATVVRIEAGQVIIERQGETVAVKVLSRVTRQ